MQERLAKIIATCGYIGFVRVGPGTFGSLFALLFWWLILLKTSLWIYALLLLASTLIGVWAIRVYDKEGRDPKEVVIDEWVGMGIAMFAIPPDFLAIAFAFLLFRIFDITKPPGVRYFDRNHLKGWGVMLDDVVAGIYALVIMQGVFAPLSDEVVKWLS